MITASYMTPTYDFRPEFIDGSELYQMELNAIDAPEFVPAGSWVNAETNTKNRTYSYTIPSCARRS